MIQKDQQQTPYEILWSKRIIIIQKEEEEDTNSNKVWNRQLLG